MPKKIQAIILAAGKSSRMWPITLSTPKPLLKIINKTIIERTLEHLSQISEIKEVLIVVGFKKEKIIKYIGDNFRHLDIKYIFQEKTDGTGGALLRCKNHINDKFIVLNGDDLYSLDAIKSCLNFNYSIATIDVTNPKLWGIVEEYNGFAKSIIEKPSNPLSHKANIGLYVLDKTIFLHSLKKTKRSEYEITDYIKFLIDKNKAIHCVSLPKNSWFPVGYPWQYLEASQYILKNIKKNIKGKVEENCRIEGPLIIGKGSVIKSFSHIEGPVYIGENCIIGPQAHIRPGSIIMNNVHFGGEIVESIMLDGSIAKHNCYLGYSVIGNNCNIGAGTITSDYRHDGENHIALIKEEKIDTERRKLGAFLGNNVRTGIGTLIYPGRKIWTDRSTLPGEIVKKDIQ